MVNDEAYNVGEVHVGDKANRDKKNASNVIDAQMVDEVKNQETQETRSDDIKFDAANNEMDEQRAVHLTDSISRVDCSMESLEKEETNYGVNEISFDLSEDGSQQSKYGDSNSRI